MPVVLSVMRFRTTEDAGEYQDIVTEEGFEPQLRRIDSDFAVVTAVSAEDEFEIQEAQRILSNLRFQGREPQVRVLSDEEVAQARRPREAPRTPTEPAVSPRARGELVTEITPTTPEKREFLRKYRQSATFKESQKRYQQSSAGREAQRRYAQSEVGKEKRRAYQQSEKGKKARQDFLDRQKEKRSLLKGQREGTLTQEQVSRFEELFGETP